MRQADADSQESQQKGVIGRGENRLPGLISACMSDKKEMYYSFESPQPEKPFSQSGSIVGKSHR